MVGTAEHICAKFTGKTFAPLARTSLNVKIDQISKSPLTRDKKMKNCWVCPLTMHGRVCAMHRMLQAAADETIASRPGLTGWQQCTLTAACARFMFG